MNPLFSSVSENVEKEAEFIYRRILNERLLDCRVDTALSAMDEEPENSDIRQVDINSC
jgi:hypothetical protein